MIQMGMTSGEYQCLNAEVVLLADFGLGRTMVVLWME